MPGLPIPHHLLKSFPQFVMTHIVKGIVNETEVDVFLEFSCFFYDPADVGNLGGFIASPMAGPQPELLILLSRGA